MATIEVENRLPTAVDLRIGKAQPADIAGESIVKDTDRVTVRPGTNWVEAEFWKAWVAEHKGSDLLQHIVAVAKPRPTK